MLAVFIIQEHSEKQSGHSKFVLKSFFSCKIVIIWFKSIESLLLKTEYNNFKLDIKDKKIILIKK